MPEVIECPKCGARLIVEERTVLDAREVRSDA